MAAARLGALALFLHAPSALAGLSYAQALDLARQAAPALRAGGATVAGAAAARPAAGTLPDPRLSAGLENLPIAGPDRWSSTRDTGTMQRLTLMQEVPNRAKRDARLRVAEARVERERATLALAALAVRREAALAWIGVYHAERRLALLADARRENQVLRETLPARIAAGTAQPAELTMARQEALAIDDRGDDLARDVKRARADLRRWVGARADEPLVGGPALPEVAADEVRGALHRHAELVPFGAMREMATAEMAEADAEKRGDWAWELVYSRRPRYDDMVSFQLSFDLPWQRDRRQQPAVEAKRQEAQRIDAEREDVLRRHAAELEAMLAEGAALEAQLARLQGPGLALAAERVALATASYQAGRADLGAVLAARTQGVDARLRVIDLEWQRDALRVRLTTLIAE
ncbi:MAG: TolC family protein [Burkholderiales bacterium]|nr:TolC family protein [Burkholderiales bacterium]